MINNTIYVHVIHEIPTSNKTGSQPYQKKVLMMNFIEQEVPQIGINHFGLKVVVLLPQELLQNCG